MLQNLTSTSPASRPGTLPTLVVGDVIRWPLGGDPGSVALIVENGTIAGSPVLTVVPGIADHAQPVRPGTLRVSRAHEVRQSGLQHPLRFNLDHRVSIACAHPALAAAQEPLVVGQLCASALERLHALRARLHALRDIAAARRQERRAERGRDPRTGWRLMPRSTQVRGAEEGRQ